MKLETYYFNSRTDTCRLHFTERISCFLLTHGVVVLQLLSQPSVTTLVLPYCPSSSSSLWSSSRFCSSVAVLVTADICVFCRWWKAVTVRWLAATLPSTLSPWWKNQTTSITVRTGSLRSLDHPAMSHNYSLHHPTMGHYDSLHYPQWVIMTHFLSLTFPSDASWSLQPCCFNLKFLFLLLTDAVGTVCRSLEFFFIPLLCRISEPIIYVMEVSYMCLILPWPEACFCTLCS